MKSSKYYDKLRIFLAEDDVEDRIFFKEAFDEIRMKHTLTIFPDGSAMMEHMLKADIEMPDIIFMDVAMPGLSGMECLEMIRNSKKLQHIVVAMYSANATPKKIEEAFVKGANVYIKKPTEFAALRKIIIDVTNISWQYVTDGLNRQQFMMSF